MVYSAGQEVWILKHNIDISSWFYLLSHLFMQTVLKSLTSLYFLSLLNKIKGLFGIDDED